MKKNWIWSVAAVATLLAVSCQHDDVNDTIKPTEGKTHSFIIKASRSIENEAEATRVTFSDAEGAQWEIGDQIHAVPVVEGAKSSLRASSSALQEGDESEGTATFTFDELADGTYRFFYPKPTSFPTTTNGTYAVRYYCAHEQTQSQAGVWGHADGLVFASAPVTLSEETPISKLTMKLCSAALSFHVYGSTHTDEYVKSITIPGIASGIRDQLYIYTDKDGVTANNTTKEGTTVTLGTPYNVPQFTDKTQCENDGIYMWMVRTNSAVGISFVVNTNKGTYTFTPESGYQFKVGLTNIYLNLSNSKAVYKPTGNVEISIPNFSQSNVYKVMLGEKQVAQIAKEFLYKEGEVNAQAIVVYPVNDGDAVELGKGFVAEILKVGDTLTNEATTTYEIATEDIHGGSVAFSTSSNAIASYTAGSSEPFSKVYLAEDGTISGTILEDCIVATVEAEIIDDVRNTEHFTYPVVKIATQYWMAENLKTARYNTNKSFEAIPTNVTANQAKNPYVVVLEDIDVNNIEGNETLEASRNKYGLLYSYAAIGGITNPSSSVSIGNAITDNISPNGWIVPTYSQYETLLAYVKWSTLLGHDGIELDNSNNITGFNALNQKYYYPSAGFTTSTAFYTTFASRTRAENNGTTPRYSAFILKDNTAEGHVAPTRNRIAFDRCMPIRCVNNGAIKITE